MYLVYINGLNGPEAQIWHDVRDSQGKEKAHLKKFELQPLQDKLSIETLMKVYPYEPSS